MERIRGLKILVLLGNIMFIGSSGSLTYAQDVNHPNNVTVGGSVKVGGATMNLNSGDIAVPGAIRFGSSTELSTIRGDLVPGRIDFEGGLNVKSNVSFGSDLSVKGNIAAKYQDVAEWVPTTAILPPGTVVVIDLRETNHVLPASKPYDTRVAGVVTAQPGIILGEAGEDKVKVAHSGRVKVKADAQFGPIEVGDLVVSSATSGYAMRSTPVEISGISIHRPGTIVGKALEPLKEGKGEILVLLTLQ